VALKKAGGLVFTLKYLQIERHLTSETVQGASLSLQSIDDIHSSDSLSLSVLGVCNGISDDVLEEDLKNTTGLFIDQTRQSLDTTTTSQSSDGWLGNTLDVISQNFSVSLGSTLS
jgi:hypothetical protein